MQVLPPVQARRQCRAVSTPLSVIATACLVFSHSSIAQQVVANGVHVQVDDGRAIDTGSTVGRAGVAVLAQDGGSVNILDTGGAVAVATHGGGAHGLVAERGSVINMRGGGISAQHGMGLFAYDDGSRIDLDNVQVFAGQTHEGARADDGARIGITGGTVTAEAGHGVMASRRRRPDRRARHHHQHQRRPRERGGGQQRGHRHHHGRRDQHQRAARPRAGGDGTGATTPSWKPTATRVRTTGNGAHGANAVSGAIRLEQADILTSGAGAAGVWVEGVNDAQGYVSTVAIRGGTVQTQGAVSHGLGALSGGKLLASDLAVRTQGQRAVGVFVVHGAEVALAGGSVTTEGAEAYGMMAAGAKPGNTQPAKLITHDVDITTHGAEAHGTALAGAADLHLHHGSVTTHGAGAAALVAAAYGQGTASALVSDARLVAHQGAGIRVEGTTLDATLRRASVSGGTHAVELRSGTAGTPATLNLGLESSTLDGAAHIEARSTFNLAVDPQSTWNTQGDAVVASLANSGMVNLVTGTAAGHTLTVTRDYTGNGGTVRLATQMGAMHRPPTRSCSTARAPRAIPAC